MDPSATFDQYLWPFVREYAPKVVGFLVAIFAAWIIAGWAQKLTRRTLERTKFDITLTKFFSSMARYVVLTLSVIACLGIFGIQTASFAAILAAGGLAVGLAFQGTLSNFAAGVMLLIFRPFKVGDVVNVAGVIGVVEEIELFFTEMKTGDNRRFIIPNSQIFGQKIENINAFPTRRVDVTIGVAYDADIDKARQVLEGVIKKMDHVLPEPDSVVVLSEIGASSIDFAVRVWCKTEDYWPLREKLIRQIKVDLDAAKISIPFPQMDVHFDAPAIDALASSSKNGAPARA